MTHADESPARIALPTRPTQWRRSRARSNLRRCWNAAIRFSEPFPKLFAEFQVRNIFFFGPPRLSFPFSWGGFISPTFYFSVGYFLSTISLGHFLPPVFCQSFSQPLSVGHPASTTSASPSQTRELSRRCDSPKTGNTAFTQGGEHCDLPTAGHAKVHCDYSHFPIFTVYLSRKL